MSAAAQEDAVRACLTESEDPKECVGATIGACVEHPGGETTVGMVECIAAENGVWDMILNEEYRALMEESRELDALDDAVAEDMTREATLRAAQRAWIAFRDANCAAEYARWGNGTMRQVAGANCILVETADRAIDLRRMRAP